ncbi:MAG: S8 family serine peptidase, partial [Acidobacteriota bacterium]
MKRLTLACIILGILSHSLAAFQNPSPPGENPGDYLVLLTEPSVVEKIMEWTPEGSTQLRRTVLGSLDAVRYHRQIEDAQLRFLQTLSGGVSGLERGRLNVLGRRAYLLNMLVVRAPASEIEQLRELPEVRAVYPNRELHLLLDSAPFLVGAPFLWEAVGGVEQAGRGMKIAIIDSGINSDHPMFQGEGFTAPAGFPLGDASLTNDKIIVARTYVKPEFGLREQDIQTPEDELGHGSQVAGIAGGRSVADSFGPLQGVAPRAFLGNYKVFGNPSVNSTTTAAAVIAAIEDAVQDGMDVINLSLGGPALPSDQDPEQMAIALAVEAGVVVVAAAGNTGPDPYSITSPGTSPDAITVGATSNARIFASALEIAAGSLLPMELGRIAYVPGTGEVISEPVGPLPMVSIRTLDETELACDSLPGGSLSGKVVLIARGTCFFSTKARNVLAANAAGMVVYNNVEGSSVVMSGLDGIQEPAVMIERSVGEALRDFLITESPAEITFRPVDEQLSMPTQPDLVAVFSGRGPSIDLEIKPDLTAPGENIHTASNKILPDPLFTLQTSGTSFSTPMVSGAAALIKQQHPDWAEQLMAGKMARAIKSALVNTAAKTAVWLGEPAQVLHTGNGRLNLEQATRISAVLDPVSASFGLVEQDLSLHLERRFDLTNLGAELQSFDIGWSETVGNRTVDISVSPTSLTLSSGETGRLTVSADLDAPLTGGIFEGFVRVTSVQSETDLSASYWGGVTVEDDSVILQVSQGGGSAFSDLASALGSAQPGNVIEISDDGIYSETLNIKHNNNGLDLNGLILRSAPGSFPIIDAGQVTSAEAVITVSNLERVTIEGLGIRGGLGGISFQNASGVIRNNVIENSVLSLSSHGIVLSGSRAHIFGNIVRGHGGSGVVGFASDALIQGNQIGGGNRVNGIFASPGGLLGIFENQILDNGSGQSTTGQGIRISNSEALIKHNTVGSTQGSSGDGIWVSGTSSKVLAVDNVVEGNGRYGMTFLQGAEGLLQRNLIQDNSMSGLRLEGGARGEIHSTRFLGNGSGIQSVASTLLLFDSLIFGSIQSTAGDGVFATAGSVEIQNSTFFGNSGFGLNLSGALPTVSHSIFHQNALGDLSGASSDDFFSNLIANGEFEGVNGNLAGDPLFAEPLNQDFSLQPDSPAIDRGNIDLSMSSLDLLSHERAVDGDGDGVAQRDLGAIEFGSDWGVPLLLPVLSRSRNEFVGLALTNAFHQDANLDFRAYSDGGQLLVSLEVQEVVSHKEFAMTLEDFLDTPGAAWVEIRSTQPELASLVLQGNSNRDFLAGAELSSALSSRLIFPEVRNQGDEETHLFLINPHSEEIEVRLEWNRSDGSRPERSVQLAGKGSFVSTVRQVFGEGSGGFVSVTVEAGQAIMGMETFGPPGARGGLAALDVGSSQSQLFSAHFASFKDVKTSLILINTGSATPVVLEALNDDGGVLGSLELEELSAGGYFSGTLQDIFEFSAEQNSGWLRIRAVEGNLLGSVTFQDPSGNFLVAAPLHNEGGRELVFGHVVHTSEDFSSLALLNSSNQKRLVSVEVFDPSAQRTGITFMELAAGQKIGRLVNEFFPDLEDQTGGFIRV